METGITQYDLVSTSKNLVILGTVGKKGVLKKSVWLMLSSPHARETFYQMGEDGRLVGKALELYQKRAI